MIFLFHKGANMISARKTNEGYIIINEKTGKLLSRNYYNVFKISKYAYAGIRKNCQEKIIDIYNKDYGFVLTISEPNGFILHLPNIDIKHELAICVELENKEFVCPNKKLFYTSFGDTLNEYLIKCNLNPDNLSVVGCSTNNNEIEFADDKKCYVFSIDDCCVIGTRQLDEEKQI